MLNEAPAILRSIVSSESVSVSKTNSLLFAKIEAKFFAPFSVLIK